MKKLWIMMLSASICFTTILGASCAAYADTPDGESGMSAAQIESLFENIAQPEGDAEDGDILVIAPAPVQNGGQKKTDTALSAAGSKQAGEKKTTAKVASKKKNPTAGQVLKSIKKSLGKSYTSDAKETKKRLETYWDLDMKKVVSYAAETNSNSSLQSDCTIVLKVKKGYAKKAASKLQKGYEQILSYNRMYNMDLQRVLQARLYINGNYVALIIEGKQADYNDSAESQAKLAAKEGKKIDKAWKKVFGSAKNKIQIPKEDKKQNNFFGAEAEATENAGTNSAGRKVSWTMPK